MSWAELVLSDISAVIALVREVCDRWDDPAAWREHLLLGACRLLHGHVGMMLADPGGEANCFSRVSVVSLVGVARAQRPLVGPAVSQLDTRPFDDAAGHMMPGRVNLYAQIVRQGWATASRAEVADDRAYYAAPYYRNVRRRLDCNDFVVSIRMVGMPRHAEAISVDRPRGVPRFGPREVALLELLHDEVAPLIGVRLTTEAHLSRTGLSKRLNETLSLLLDGRSEKEVARSLRLGVRTVHEYVTALYKHFRVSSRAELLHTLFIAGPCRSRPGNAVTAAGSSWATPTTAFPAGQSFGSKPPVNLDTGLDAEDPATGAAWTLDEATDLTDDGIIVGYGTLNDGPGGMPDGQRAYLLDASSIVPEPSSACLLMCGLLIMGYGARRRVRSDELQAATSSASS